MHPMDLSPLSFWMKAPTWSGSSIPKTSVTMDRQILRTIFSPEKDVQV